MMPASRSFAVLSLLVLVACGGAPPTAAVSPAPGAAAGPPSSGPADAGSPAEQVALGAQLYAAQCAGCHGDAGEGDGKMPALVGKGALPLEPPAGSARKTPFRTAADVMTFVQEAMPPKKPGSLSDEETAAIVAFALKANGVDVSATRLDRQTAQAILLHP